MALRPVKRPPFSRRIRTKPLDKVANRAIATGLESADGSAHRKLLQCEIEISRWPAISSFQIGATLAAGLSRRALLWPIDVVVGAGPSLPPQRDFAFSESLAFRTGV